MTETGGSVHLNYTLCTFVPEIIGATNALALFGKIREGQDINSGVC